ncbi:hypothetical protein UPYG_G00194000 [Umbra pygmaea]|uniref:Claudin n=1 Tax=Umbra pygmaea TaxID=75934 RepID=A0ABD0WGQ2_UMBPY
MVQGTSEIAALCLGLVGLLGAAATTGMPMWKVTAFIGENIITMETRWEGLWMNCYRQANIRMQCKVYDSLLYLPTELQTARGLMCCSVALSGLAFLGALSGMRCTSCVQNNDRAKSLILMVAGAMQLLASICVFIPVSWTANAIIRDFYNPLLIDAQRRELGEALYIGWVTGAFLLGSGLLFVCHHVPSHKAVLDFYQPPNRPYQPTLMRYNPITQSHHGVNVGQQTDHQDLSPNRPYAQRSVIVNTPAAAYNPRRVESAGSLVCQPRSIVGQPSQPTFTSYSSSYVSSLSSPGNALPISVPNPYNLEQTPLYPTYSGGQQATVYSYSHQGNPPVSHSTTLQTVSRNPVLIRHKGSGGRRSQSQHSGSSVGMYI